ncbi:hypothetical protein [Virgibacillus sp. SK37]|nr:hypothetical protein [Virgibacillus sp. SK37]
MNNYIVERKLLQLHVVASIITFKNSFNKGALIMTNATIDLFMIVGIDEEKKTISLYDPIFDKEITYLAKDQDEIDVYSSVFNDCQEINMFISVEYNEEEKRILRH